MNTLMLVVLAVVLLCYCGGKYCPKVLSSNKEMLLGVLVGLVLCSFAGLKLEGLPAAAAAGPVPTGTAAADQFRSEFEDYCNAAEHQDQNTQAICRRLLQAEGGG